MRTDAVPTRTKPIYLHGERCEAFKIVTENWVKEGLIERPPENYNIEWVSPAFVVPKKSTDFPWRGVVDMRGPNSQTRRCSYPLPKIEEVLVKHGAGYLHSVMDLRQAFHQQPMHPDSRPITCTHTADKIYQWKVNIMGLTNAAQQFQAMIEDCLEPVTKHTTPYIDDILTSSRLTAGEDVYKKHYEEIRSVLLCMKEDDLIADIKNVSSSEKVLTGADTHWKEAPDDQHREG